MIKFTISVIFSTYAAICYCNLFFKLISVVAQYWITAEISIDPSIDHTLKLGYM